jgi:hypothetical protein
MSFVITCRAWKALFQEKENSRRTCYTGRKEGKRKENRREKRHSR